MAGLAALVILLAATGPPLPSKRILPLLAAALRAAPRAASPSPFVVRRTLGADLFQTPKRTTDGDTEWLRFESSDGTCNVELGPIVGGKVLKLTASCRYATRDDAIEFLHDMVEATESDWQPPVFFATDGEMAHIAVIVKPSPTTAEAYLQREEDGKWRAAVVIAVGGRSVLVTPP